MDIAVEKMKVEDWPAVKDIYREGIATGNATFYTEAPEWEIALEPVTRHEGFYYNLNAAPAISRDGKRIAFVSNRSLYNDIYVLDVDGKGDPKRLVKGARSG